MELRKKSDSMNDNMRFIEIFMTRFYEKNVEIKMLADRKYAMPKEDVIGYIQKVLAIPYIDFLEFSKLNQETIDDTQLTQSSSFAACSTEMCKVLETQGNTGLNYVQIGRLFPQYVKVANDVAFRKYGENQVKTSSQLGLTFEYYGCWYLTCLGYVFNYLDFQQQNSLLARTILRVPLYRDIMTRILYEDVNITDYMESLAISTKGRRSGSIVRMVNVCLTECRREGIEYKSLLFPHYVSKSKSLKICRQDGNMHIKNISMEFADFKPKTISPIDNNRRLIPEGSLLKEIIVGSEERKLIHNMMALDEGTTIMEIVAECQKRFQEKYFSMSANDWRHLIGNYVRNITNRMELKDNEKFTYKVA